MLGGLARRVAYVEKVRTEKQAALVVDSGDLFFSPHSGEAPERKLAKARLISRAYREMGAAAVNVGDMDLFRGLIFCGKKVRRASPWFRPT